MPCKVQGTNVERSRLRYRNGNNDRHQHKTL